MSADDQRLRGLPLAVGGAIVLVAALAIGVTAPFTRTDSRTPPGRTSETGVSSSAPAGEVRGTLLISPPFSAPYATSGSIVITGTRRFTVTVGRSGRFTVVVPPGGYTVIGHTPKFSVDGHEGDCMTGSGSIVVRAHEVVTVTATCLEK